MIVIINGAFGVGKTTVAERLLSTLPNSMLYDPEEVGYMVRAVTQNVRTGVKDTDDFQDIALEIKRGLCRIGLDLHHFCLTASAQTAHQRLERRGDAQGSWAFRQTAWCVEALRSREFRERIDTECREPPKSQTLFCAGWGFTREVKWISKQSGDRDKQTMFS
jgi:hypothetical protein